MKKIRRLSINKATLHRIIWGDLGSGYGIKIDNKKTLWFLGTEKTNHKINVEIVSVV